VPPGVYSRGTVITVPYGFLSIVQRKESDIKGKNLWTGFCSSDIMDATMTTRS
jgi:hypothetical protein